VSKYQEIEDVYTNDLDTWLANLYFIIQRRDTLANPYSVQLVLDEDSKQRHEKYIEVNRDDELDKSTDSAKPRIIK